MMGSTTSRTTPPAGPRCWTRCVSFWGARPHYVLYPEQERHDSDYRYNYLNDAEIRAIMEASPRRLLSLSGHLHRGHPPVTHDGVTYFIGGALCEHPFRYYLLHADADEITVQEFHAA